jgi:hypothetical protein
MNEHKEAIMPAPFKQITLEQFIALLAKFEFKRQINAVHMHHTWKPTRAQYKSHETIVAMWQYHTQVNGWQDIAQHITIAPDGVIWLGRNWNLPPASAAGHNGNLTAGPFMFEMIGNFDEGNDPFDGEQRATALQVIAGTQRRFGLAPETLVFHHAMSSKSCPGSDIDYQKVIDEVRELHVAMGKTEQVPRDRVPAGGPFGEEALESTQIIEEALALLNRDGAVFKDPPDAELTHEEGDATALTLSSAERTAGAREAEVGPEMIDALRPHLINLNMGQFSAEGELTTAPGDVDAIFEEHLVQALDVATRKDEKLRLLLFAHGGLVKESDGLRVAYKHVSWWKQNNIYPIYFIWETGAFETIGQLLVRARGQTARALARDFWDHTTDPLIEAGVRALQAPRIWAGMKLSAQLAVGSGRPEGGARYVAKKLKKFCDDHAGQIELHAAGHSAGSIFHAHFIATALDLGVPHFKSAHFLAPAIDVDTFRDLLAKRIGERKGIEHLSIFTMRKDYEQDDNCFGIYRKSLLYLIYYALEPESKIPVLGLEISLREDAALRRLFGLGTATPGGSAPGEVIWSVSPADVGRSATTSTTHGGFDDDSPTMNSIARRILGKADADKIVEYAPLRTGIRAASLWEDQVDWPDQLEVPAAAGAWRPPPTTPAIPTPTVPTRASAPVGRRRALCIGINRYPTAPLAGCVADAQAWAAAFTQLGFEAPALLFDEQATRSAIADHLGALVTSSAPGDVIVFQFAGHGTQLPDVTGDEAGGDTPERDEAICPYDFASGAFLIDDDVRAILDQLPDGVNLTCFIDCCHSGTISRFAIGATSGNGAAYTDRRPRFIVANPDMINAHRQFRRSIRSHRSGASRGLSLMKESVFSACLSSEVAWESAGHGDFTTHAIRALQSGTAGLTNEQFVERVIAAFGTGARQHPVLDPPHAQSRRFLQPLSAYHAETYLEPARLAASVGEGNGSVNLAGPQFANLVQALQDLTQQLQKQV